MDGNLHALTKEWDFITLKVIIIPLPQLTHQTLLFEKHSHGIPIFQEDVALKFQYQMTAASYNIAPCFLPLDVENDIRKWAALITEEATLQDARV